MVAATAAEVVAALEGALAAAGWQALRLSVVDEDADAAAFWEHLGYQPVGRLDGGVTVYEREAAKAPSP